MKFARLVRDIVGSHEAPRTGEIGLVEFNDRGGWSIRRACFPPEDPVGNYPTAEDACRVVRQNGGTPRINLDRPAPLGAMKYVIVRERSGVERILFCFTPTTHHELAQVFGRATGAEPVSAGFVEFLGAQARTYGESVSLDLKPRDQDARLISALYRATAVTSAEQQRYTYSHAHTHQSSHA